MRQSALITTDSGGARTCALVAGDGRAEFAAALESGQYALVELATLVVVKKRYSSSAGKADDKAAKTKKRPR